MVGTIELVGFMLLIVAITTLFRFKPNAMPAMWKLNEWPLKAVVIEKNANMLIPKQELARSRKDSRGEWYFELKSGLKTSPKKLTDLYSDQMARGYLFLIQTGRDTLDTARLSISEQEKTVKALSEEEETKTWERMKYRELQDAHSKQLTALQIYLPIGLVIFALIGVAIFFAIIYQPMIEAAQVSSASALTLATASDRLANALEILASI